MEQSKLVNNNYFQKFRYTVSSNSFRQITERLPLSIKVSPVRFDSMYLFTLEFTGKYLLCIQIGQIEFLTELL